MGSLSWLFSQHDVLQRTLQCVTVGRANVDFYPREGEHLNKARYYDVFVGGSPANIAGGLSRLGIRTGILTRVADDDHGKFVVDYLSQQFGIDTSQVQFDSSGAKTSLAFAERRPDAVTVMYRNNVADLQLSDTEIDKDYIRHASTIFISGTALTECPSRDTIFKILEYAREYHTLVVLDIDYRPYGWRSSHEVKEVLTHVISQCDIVIGTRDEFEKAGVSMNVSDEECGTSLLAQHAKLVVIKHGSQGSFCIYKDEHGTVAVCEGKVFPVTVKKPYGAGDAFASGLLGCLIKGHTVAHALEYAAASASINITAHSCIEAMPTEQEITEFISLQQ